MKKQQILKLRTMKIAYWVFCASKYNRKLQIFTFGEIHTIRFSNFNRIRIQILFGFGKSCGYEYEYYSVMKNHPNTNSIRIENICRIRIRISLFRLNYSNTIWIPNYSLTSDHQYDWLLQNDRNRKTIVDQNIYRRIGDTNVII